MTSLMNLKSNEALALRQKLHYACAGCKLTAPSSPTAIRAVRRPGDKSKKADSGIPPRLKAMSTDGTLPLPGSISHLGASLHFKGEISGDEDLRVDGSLEGPIRLEGRNLTIGASAKLTADIVAPPPCRPGGL